MSADSHTTLVVARKLAGTLAALCLAGCAGGSAGSAGSVAAASEQKGVEAAGIETSQPAAETAQPQTILPLPDSHALRQLLLDQHYDELDALLEQYRVQFVWDVAHQEVALVQAYKSFEIEDSKIIAQLDAWIAAQPGSYQAYTARTYCFRRRGWDARGEAFSKDTKPEQFEAMNRFFVQAEQDARTALKLQPNSMAPYRVLVDIARADIGDKLRAPLEEGLRKYPASYNLRAIALFDLQPKWGGSLDRMEAFAQAAQAYAAQNPRLKILLGYPDWARGQDLYRAERYQEAYDDYNKALQYGDEGDFLVGRNNAELQLKRYKEAFADANRLKQLEPWREGDDDQIKVTTYYAMNEAGKRFRADQYPGAIEVYSFVLQQNPDDLEALTWRGIGYCYLDKVEPAIVDLRHAIDIDPKSGDANDGITQCLDTHGRARDAIPYEEAYLKLNPGNGEGYFQLAYLYHHAGDDQKGAGSMRKSCSLGFEQSCAMLKKLANGTKAQSGAGNKN